MPLSCGTNATGGTTTSGIKFRAFVSNAVTAGNSVALIYIVNAQTDVHPPLSSTVAGGLSPRMMVVTPNHTETLVFSGDNSANSDNQFTIVNNGTETDAAHIILPGYTESFVASPDSSTAYIAVPNATVTNQSPGAIELVNLASGTFAGEIDIPSVHYLSINNGGSRLLAFATVPDTVDAPCSTAAPCFLYVITPANLGTSQPVVVPIPSAPAQSSLDHPVAAFFSSDDTTAYVVNCGAECGGTQSSVQRFDMTTNTPGSPVLLPAASEALVNGSTMYVAGTPFTPGPNPTPSFTCPGAKGEMLTCGVLSVLSLNPPVSVLSTDIAITDGYHNRIALGADGQLFIGANNCTEIVPTQPPPAGAEVRGCLSIYNTQSVANGNVPAGGVVIPPANGDVTGIQPLSNRSIVYVVEGYPSPGGSLFIYCTAIDANNNCPAADAIRTPAVNEPTYAPLMTGSFYDVKIVDF